MDELQQDWQAARIVHLLGGCRAVNGFEEAVRLEPATGDGDAPAISIASYPQLFDAISRLGLQVVGCDFLIHKGDFDGTNPPDWRAFHRMGSVIWPCAEQADQWSFIAHGAFQSKFGELWDVASRISHQLRVCEWRLRQLSDAYRDLLASRMRAGEFKDGTRFNNKFTWLGYLAIQAFLVDACVLRDYLAEYYAISLAMKGTPISSGRVTRMAVLSRRLSPGAPGSIEGILVEATGPDGWLHELGQYRDLVVHVAPLAHADRSLFAVCQSLVIGIPQRLPSIKLPIPARPGDISQKRSSGEYFQDPNLDYARFKNVLQDHASARDGLEYAHTALGRLAWLAWHLSVVSPVEAKMPLITEADIISFKVAGSDQ